jgi:hypothetical protein
MGSKFVTLGSKVIFWAATFLFFWAARIIFLSSKNSYFEQQIF